MAMQGNMRRQSTKIHIGMSFWVHVSIYSACNCVFHCIWYYYNPPYWSLAKSKTVQVCLSTSIHAKENIILIILRWRKCFDIKIIKICTYHVIHLHFYASYEISFFWDTLWVIDNLLYPRKWWSNPWIIKWWSWQ